MYILLIIVVWAALWRFPFVPIHVRSRLIIVEVFSIIFTYLLLLFPSCLVFPNKHLYTVQLHGSNIDFLIFNASQFTLEHYGPEELAGEDVFSQAGLQEILRDKQPRQRAMEDEASARQMNAGALIGGGKRCRGK